VPYDGNRRVFVVNPASANITGGGATTTVTVASTTGLSVGQTVPLLGGTPENRTITALTATTITFAAVNGTTHTSVVWGVNLTDDPTVSTNVTINSVVYPMTFFGYGQVGFLVIDATGLTDGSITSAAIYGATVSNPSNQLIAIDQTDAVSKKLYKREFLLSINSQFFNDISYYQDLLLNGKFAKLYLQQLDTPSYPLSNVTDVIGITDSGMGVSGSLFEVVEVKHEGWHTTITGKAVSSAMTI
jgi:hypothetical protein